MAKSVKVHPKKRRGRPATGKDPLVSARLPQRLIDQVEQWSASNAVTRSEAIRRLVEIGLTVKKKSRPTNRMRATRAAELAAEALASLSVGAADTAEQADRRRRLTKGPLEFREHRVDLPKAKGK
jgi:hypothetical protein